VTTVAEQVERIQWLLQDTDTTPTKIAQVITAEQESAQYLARLKSFTQITWVNAITNQARYTLSDNNSIDYVLYNERVLRYATEETLDRTQRKWEGEAGEPHYWTTNNQSPNTVRIVPAPQRTGSTVPVFPSPLIMPMIDNLVIFTTDDISAQMDDVSDVLPTLASWDDVLVWRTARMLAERETTVQNLPVAALCKQLEDLWITQMRKE